MVKREVVMRVRVAMKKRAEQQAFAAKNLNYVMDTYIPDKLKNTKTWLP